MKTYSIGITILLICDFFGPRPCVYDFNEGLTYLCFGKGYKTTHELNVRFIAHAIMDALGIVYP